MKTDDMDFGRVAAYAAIDSERDYQEALRAASHNAGGPPPEVAAFLLYMDEYLSRAKRIAAADWSSDAGLKTLHQIRKVAALAVACMEVHGAPLQRMPDAEVIADRVQSIR